MYREQKNNILLYPCTIVGYIRLILLSSAIVWHVVVINLVETQQVQWGVALLTGLSLLLDLLDGHLARKFGQATSFGTLFDLAIDLITHTFVWIISGFYFAGVFIILEWTTGLYIVAFSMRPAAHWKNTLIDQGPLFIKLYFSANQRNLWSAYGNISHFVFPITLCLSNAPIWLSFVTLPGLIIYEVVTLYMLYILVRVLAANH
jgi:phosphatidylglycerophosphate synthase